MHITSMASVVLILWSLLEKHGFDPAPLFWEQKLNPNKMRLPGARFQLDKVDKLWWKATEIIDDPCFGLKAAELWHPSNFGALGYGVLASDTLQTALERIERYHRVVSDEKFLQLHKTHEGLRVSLSLSTSVASRDIPARNDAILAILLSMCRVNCQKDLLAPLSVTFTHPKPACSAKYFEYFKAPVYFSREANSFTLSADAVETILPGSNPQLAGLNDQVMINYLAQLEQKDIVQKVKAIIIDLLPSGSVTDESVAKKLYMSTRNLQRQLQKEGTTFNTILSETRLDLARQYVADEDISMTEIAFLLGFSESSAFSRAFKRWTGHAPSKYRKIA